MVSVAKVAPFAVEQVSFQPSHIVSKVASFPRDNPSECTLLRGCLGILVNAMVVLRFETLSLCIKARSVAVTRGLLVCTSCYFLESKVPCCQRPHEAPIGLGAQADIPPPSGWTRTSITPNTTLQRRA